MLLRLSHAGSANSRMLRSSPAPEGRCCQGGQLDAGRVAVVAILTGPGGPVLLPLVLLALAVVAPVAILTGPEGPVLPG